MPVARYPKLGKDLPTLDFSGFAVYTHADVPDEVITSICAALEARKERIGWQEPGPLPLERGCRDTADGPLVIPLHPAAEKFWRGQGYLELNGKSFMESTESTHTVRGFCALCTAHCATIATVTDGKVVRLEADADHPNGGVFCLKGKAAPELVYHPDRLNYPLKRTRPKGDSDPGWQRVSWDEALDDIAQRLIAIREHDGARAVALAKGTGGGTSVSDAERWLARLLNRFGSPNWTSTTHVCNWHKDTGFTYTFGVEIPTPDVAHSGAFLLWGHNPSSTSLILAHDIVAARKRGMKIVAVDPRRVGIAAQADVLLQVRPGTDGALALAMIDVAITEKLFDDGFVRQWTNGTFLIRLDTGAALTEADLTASGSSKSICCLG